MCTRCALHGASYPRTSPRSDYAMPVNLLRTLLTSSLLMLLNIAFGQADVSVRLSLPSSSFVAANAPTSAWVLLTNEGSEPRFKLSVQLQLSPSLFFVDAQARQDAFDMNALQWHVEELAVGKTDTLFVQIQPNSGGTHTLSAELLSADTVDWDSTPGNGNAREDDQDDLCLSVPISLDCGQYAVLRAPSGKTGYSWFRNDTLLAYATTDTLLPSATGDYRYVVTGEVCASGACCPVRITRAGCAADLALVASATPLQAGSDYQRVTVKIYNEGAQPVSRLSLYVTTSGYTRLNPNVAQTGWQMAGTRMTREWTGLLAPGDSTSIDFEIQTISGGTAADYTLFAEIYRFFSGTKLLLDVDSTPDENPANDKVVDNGRNLSPNVDEDDSDLVVLTSCPAFRVTGNETVCSGATVTLLAEAMTPAPGSKFVWIGNAAFSCRECANPKITVTADVAVTLEAMAPNGCVYREIIQLRTKPCQQEMLLVVSPYGPAEECLAVTPGTKTKWCYANMPQGLALAEVARKADQLCLTGTSTGAWAGLVEPCLELCQGASCTPAQLKVLVLPKRDEVALAADGKACLKSVLQVDGPVVSSRVVANSAGFALVPEAPFCYTLSGETAVHPEVRFTVIHEYALAGRAVYDTTIVIVPAKTTCAFDVFAEANYMFSTPAGFGGLGRDHFVCAIGTLQALGAVSFSFAGKPLAAPQVGCEPVGVAKFSLRGFPSNATDNGWRIERYEVAGVAVIKNKSVQTLAAVVAAIRQVDPSASVSADLKAGVLEVSGYSKQPVRLALRHLASNVGINVQPIVINGFRGWRLVLPEGTQPGSYSLTAKNAQGCIDEATVKVEIGQTVITIRDTLRIKGEVAQPLYVDGLAGFAAPTASSWTTLATGYKTTPMQSGVLSALFVNASVSPRRERLVLVDVEDRVCAPLYVAADVTVTTTTCMSQTVALGLSRPDLPATATTGTLSLTKASGKRAGGVYRISDLINGGLTARYTVTNWPGVPKASQLSGNLPEILREMRRRGIDVYADWTGGLVHVSGATSQAVSFSVSGTGATSYSWQPVATELTTYGELYLRPGIAAVSINLGSCKSSLTVNLKCSKQPPVSVGMVMVLAGGSLELPRQSIPGSGNATSISITDMPTGIWGELDPNGGLRITAAAGSLGDYVLRLEVCRSTGDCQPADLTVRVGQEPCTVNIWRDELNNLLIPAGADHALLYLPAGFDATTDEVWVDGAPAGKALSNVKLNVERLYHNTDAYVAVKTPFGKTVDLRGQRFSAALADVFPEAQIVAQGEDWRVQGLDNDQPLYVQNLAGLWLPFNYTALRAETRAVVMLRPGKHTVELKRLTTSNAAPCGDELKVEVTRAPVSVLTERINLMAGQQREYCLPPARKGVPVLDIVNDCVAASGERATVSAAGDCWQIEAQEAGSEAVCLRRVYLDGGVDSVRLLLNITERFELTARPDRDSIEFGEFKVIEVLDNDALAAEPLSLSLVSEPYFGRAQVVGNSAIEYLHLGGDCAKDVFTYEICQGDECRTATVELEVFCDELLIYNGLSPNGDGINEEFVILGLNQYPKHQLTIFNREGNLLAEFRDYANDWRGTVDGAPLPEGTYFYVIELGNGESRSGYIQLSR